MLGLSIQSDDPTHPKVLTESDPKTGRPDQVTGRRRVICYKNWLQQVGLGFPPQNLKKPDPTNVLRISSKNFPNFGRNFQNLARFSRFWRDFPDSGLKFLDFGNKLSYFGNLSSRSSKISPNPVRSTPDLAFFHLKSTILAGFFTMDGSDWINRVSSAKPTAPIRFPRRLVVGQDFLNPILSGRSWVGHKPDPDRPVDTTNGCYKLYEKSLSCFPKPTKQIIPLEMSTTNH